MYLSLSSTSPPILFAGRDSVLRAYPVTGRAEERAQARDHPVVCLGGA